MGKFMDLLVKWRVFRYDPFAKLAAERLAEEAEKAEKAEKVKDAKIESAKNPARIYKLNPEKLKKAEKHFLTTFRSVTKTDWFSKGTDWGAIYRRSLCADPELVFSAFLDNGLVRSATPEELVDADYKVVDLRTELKNRSLKVSGKKADLIQRLLSAEPNYQTLLTTQKPRYVVTEKGRIITKEYFLEEEKIKQQAIAKFRKEFHGGSLLAAEEAALAYRNEHPLGPGLSSEKIQSQNRLKELFHDIPPVIMDVEPVYLELAREIAAADAVFGSRNIVAPEWLSTQTAIGITVEKVSVVFSKMMWYRSEVQKAKSHHFYQFYYFMGRADGCCDECKKLLDTFYPIESEIPVLPNEKCLNYGLCNISVMCVSKLLKEDLELKASLKNAESDNCRPKKLVLDVP